MRARPPGRRGHDAAEPQRHGGAAAGRRPVPAPTRARHQQQPAGARARVRGPVAADHADRQEQPDRRRRVPQGVRARRPHEGAERQRQPAVALSRAAARGHHARVPVHGQQPAGRDTQGRQPARQVRARARAKPDGNNDGNPAKKRFTPAKKHSETFHA